ncbi:MAG: hypothetical protein L6R41_008038 [Letrouitia leprolyta]|nr:MAG: hypothetical protein L6R41_008038 [Letrouitia leprolyta]
MYLNPTIALAAYNFSAHSSPSPFPQQAILCYDSRHASLPVAYTECEPIVTYKIATGPRPATPILFGRRPAPGVLNRVPKTWESPPGHCIVGIDVPATSMEQTSLLEIQAAARAILMKCVLADPHLGGMTFIGATGNMLVEVMGV